MYRPLLLTLGVILAFVSCAEPPLDEISWEEDYQAALTTGKPVVVNFWRPG
ncbi:MAG: hypothetical protein GY855_05935 [candidate division Zixibacteria bacterium]|nr:hypothetical protein [candidate division Zixibacteria bacterium]